MAITYSIKDSGWLGLLKLTGMGLGMFLKGKIKLRHSRVLAINYIRNFFKSAEDQVNS